MAIDLIVLDDRELIRNTTYKLWDELSEDGFSFEDWEQDPSYTYMGIVSGNDYLGFFKIKPITSITLEIHAGMLPEFRERYSIDAGFYLMSWVVQNTSYERAESQVPATHKNVINYMEHLGFTNEGTKRKSYIKNGKAVDQVIMGLLRSEMISILYDRECA